MREVTVVFKGGNFIETNMNGTDEEIRNYYKVGSKFNIGSGEHDKIAEVREVYIYDKEAK